MAAVKSVGLIIALLDGGMKVGEVDCRVVDGFKGRICVLFLWRGRSPGEMSNS